MARLSMRDVAARAQVSIGTVSNVVNNPDIVLPATREKVQQAIADLGWVPNQQAQQLRAGRGRTIGLAVMDVTNPFFADLLRAAQDVLFTHGFHATIGDANIDEARQTAILRTFLQQRVRGVILGPIGPQPSEVGALAKAHLPTVLVDRAADSVECCAVGVDDVAGGRIAIEHLVSQGHRRVAFVGGPSSLKQIRDRLEGAQAAALAGGADLLSISVPQLDFASGRLAADQVVQMDPRARPTGVFCANDLVAIAFLQGSPRQASTPSRTATTAITNAATESAHPQPSRLLSSNPTSTAALRYVQISVCFESATAEAEPSSRPVRRSNQLRNGITARLSAARAIPTGECSASRTPNSDSAASTLT